jgi:DNA-binding SARP family transcriptional activator
LWPGSEGALAVQSLRTLTHALYKLLGERLGGAPPVLRRGGAYQLNTGAGIGVDIVTFEALAASGHLRATRGEAQAAAGLYVRASMMYAGDLCIAGDVHALIERERLRGLYLNVLAQLADHFFQADEYVESLEYAQALLGSEPCREDAHRLAMRCYLRMGQRTQALRQYRLCVDILRAEFDAAPELSTSDLYERMRHQPNSL